MCAPMNLRHLVSIFPLLHPLRHYSPCCFVPLHSPRFLIFHLISAWLALLFPPHCSFTLCSLLPFPLYNSPCCFSLSLLCHSPARSLIDSGGDVTGMPSGSSLFCRRAAGVRVECRFTAISLSLCERQDRVARGRQQ